MKDFAAWFDEQGAPSCIALDQYKTPTLVGSMVVTVQKIEGDLVTLSGDIKDHEGRVLQLVEGVRLGQDCTLTWHGFGKLV